MIIQGGFNEHSHGRRFYVAQSEELVGYMSRCRFQKFHIYANAKIHSPSHIFNQTTDREKCQVT